MGTIKNKMGKLYYIPERVDVEKKNEHQTDPFDFL